MLSLSGLYGKPVMTFASVVNNLLETGYEKEGSKEFLTSYFVS